MCLVIVASRVRKDYPLIVAANRDELFTRPATPLAVLRDDAPRILGGRDLVHGGTWLAVNEHGAVSALTNQQRGASTDPTKRSRGHLPLAAAHQADAARAAEHLRGVRVDEYNACALVIADRADAHYVHIDAAAHATARHEQLGPGLHVLENRALGTPSPKVDAVRAALVDLADWPAHELLPRLIAILSNRAIPPGAPAADGRPPELEAACVQLGPYGTRSATLVFTPEKRNELPRVWHLDAAPAPEAMPVDCTDAWVG